MELKRLLEVAKEVVDKAAEAAALKEKERVERNDRRLSLYRGLVDGARTIGALSITLKEKDPVCILSSGDMELSGKTYGNINNIESCLSMVEYEPGIFFDSLFSAEEKDVKIEVGMSPIIQP